ncbi:MAG: twitching motility protein PilT [Rhizobium sp.]|nr:twitching motility protein PilT [Rhizobium sp.]
MYIFDTNVISELRKTKSGRADKAVVKWVQSVPPSGAFLSAITVYEIKLGILKLVSRDPPEAQRLDDWLSHTIVPSFAGRILPLDENVAILLAGMMATRTRPYRDALIAATAQHHGYAVVTRNFRDFAELPVRVINPWDFT